MTTFLWVIAIVGAWNFVNLLLRIYYGTLATTYYYHIVIGFWAAYLLWVN
jgi:hypothetical protein